MATPGSISAKATLTGRLSARHSATSAIAAAPSPNSSPATKPICATPAGASIACSRASRKFLQRHVSGILLPKQTLVMSRSTGENPTVPQRPARPLFLVARSCKEPPPPLSSASFCQNRTREERALLLQPHLDG